MEINIKEFRAYLKVKKKREEMGHICESCFKRTIRLIFTPWQLRRLGL